MEEYGYGYSTHGPVQTPGHCLLSAGGKTIQLNYFLHVELDAPGWDDVARKSRQPGNTPLALGEAKGYAKAHGTSLFIACPAGKRKEILLEISTGNSGNKLSEDSAELAKMAALTGDLARNVAPRVEFCGSAPKLPPGPPSIG